MQNAELQATKRRAILLECQYAASLYVIGVLKALSEMENTEIHDPTTASDSWADDTSPYPFTHYFHKDGRVVPIHEERLKHPDNPGGKLTATQQAFIQGFNEHLDDLLQQAEQNEDTTTLEAIGDVASFRQQALSYSLSTPRQPPYVMMKKVRNFAHNIILPDWERAMKEWNGYVIDQKLDAGDVEYLRDTLRARQRRKK